MRSEGTRKRTVLLGVVILLEALLSFPPQVTAQEEVTKPVIAVSRFDNSTGRPVDVGVGLADKLNLALEATQKFTIVERVRLEDIMKNLRLELSGLVDPEHAKEVGKLLSVDYLVVGNLHQFDIQETRVPIGGLVEAITGRPVPRVGFTNYVATVAVAVSFMNAETGQSEFIAEGTGVREGGGLEFNIYSYEGLTWGQLNRGVIGEAINDAINEAVLKIKQKLFVPQIISRKADEVYIDMGISDGVMVGDRFVVERIEVLPGGHNIPVKVGEVQVNRVYDTASKAVILYGLDKINPGLNVRKLVAEIPAQSSAGRRRR